MSDAAGLGKAKAVYSHESCQWGVEVNGRRLESDGKRWVTATAELFADGLNEILKAEREKTARRCAEIAATEWCMGKNSIVRGQELTSGLCERIEANIKKEFSL